MQKVHWKPHNKQIQALESSAFEILYGGARGGGKTDAGQAWLLYDIDKPAYRALVIRLNATDLHDWIDRAKNMFAPCNVKVTGTPPVFEFPSGAKIFTGHLKDENAFDKYKGHEYCRMLIEELTQIATEERYLKLISSCRSTTGIRPQIFATTNPDGKGHTWVKKRFVEKSKPGDVFIDSVTGRSRVFIPATIDDNPTLLEKDPEYSRYLEGLPEDLKQAWRYGSWDISNIKGSYYQDDLTQAKQEGRITFLGYDRNVPVHTVWDLGIGDDQSCIFFQLIKGKINIIDSFNEDGKGYNFYSQMLHERSYKYGTMYLPHDGNKRSADTLASFADHLENNGFNVTIIKRTKDVVADINKARANFPKIFFNKKKCEYLLECLRMYRREFDEARNCFKDTPIHDWTSHFADAFRYLGGAIENIGLPQVEEYEYQEALDSYLQ